MQRILTRLAPTPSGFIHPGNVYNFLLNWLWARSQGGQVLLRIDDADAARKRPEYVEDIFRVLDWLGLDWDIGPAGVADFEQNWPQAKRTDLYNDLLNELTDKNLLFACTCSRKQLGNGEKPYPDTCRQKALPLATPEAAWRIQIGNASTIEFTDRTGKLAIDIATSHGCFVVRKKDGAAAYQVSSLADDRHFGVTHIARGQDLLPSTAMQLYIDQQLSQPYFNQCQFWHHPLLISSNGDKLSKSAGHLSQSILHTFTKTDLLKGFAEWMGWEMGGDVGLTNMLEWMKVELR